MKLSVMTLGCPTWDLQTIVRRAAEYGYDGIDFRGIGGEIDVTKLPAFTTDVAATLRLLSDHGLVVSGISSSLSVCDPDKRAANLDEAKRTIDAALAVGAQHVRVFGNGNPARDGYDAAAGFGAECVRQILALPEATRLHWNFETHDHWIESRHCRLLLDAVTDAAFGAAWDMGHTRRVAGELPEQTLAALGGRLHYCHVKDAVHDPSHPNAMKDGWRYVLPGQGQLHLADALAALQTAGYDGWIMFEHEKRWHPDLAEPEVAFPAFVRWAKPLLKTGG